VDFTRHLRNWENLSQKDKDEYYDGLMDTLTLNGFYDVATNFLAGVAIEKIAIVI
jgi:hypothetical protein